MCEGTRLISEEVLGHSSPHVNKRYIHLAEELENYIKNQNIIQYDEN